MNALTPLLNRATTWWAERAPRERVLFVAMSAVLAVALVVVIVSNLRSEQARLAKTLPMAQARLAAMRDGAAEIQRLQRQPAITPLDAGKLAEALEASAKAHGLQVTVNANVDGPRISGSADFDQLMDWLAQVQRDHGARITRLTVTREGPKVRFDGELASPRAG